MSANEGDGRLGPGTGAGRLRQGAIFRAGVSGTRPVVPTSWPALEEAARRRMSRQGWAYVAGGAGAETTMAANRRGFEELELVPRMLAGTAERDLSVQLFGRRLPTPLLLAPVGVAELAHRSGDLGAARAAAAEGVPMVFSNQASVPMEECAAAMGDAPRWFQLYWSTDDELVESFLRRAERCGCEAIVLTLDTTMLGWRPRDLDLGFLPFSRGQGIAQYTSDPVFHRLVEERAAAVAQDPARGPDTKVTVAAVRTLLSIARRHPGTLWENLRSPLARTAVELFTEIYSRPAISWRDLAWLRERTSLPLLLKGILHPDDARQALEHGVDGLIVSTHGGRQVDGSVGSVTALPQVLDAVGGQVPVLLDSGVRSGADMAKALHLGADAVLVGRAWVYGLAAGGERGVREVLENLVAELDLTMCLLGCSDVEQLREATVLRSPSAG